MQSLFAVKNATSFPVISIGIDGERIFSDIIKGDTSPYIFLPSGSIALSVFNNSGKLIFDEWISVPPQKKLILSVYDQGLKFM